MARGDRQLDFGPQRAAWRFALPYSKLKTASEQRLSYHQKRLSYWKGELVKATKAVKDSTELRVVQVTGGVQHTAVVDQEKSNYMSTCSSKIGTHREAVLNFAQWVELFGSVTEETYLSLTFDDAKYFRVSKVEADDE